ncbi:Methylcrotonoyl-CoA carboxylase subunit alpha, mitochondrial, partial [Ascosphaera atra]
ESPAPGLALNLRKDLWNKARAAARAVGYCGAGTVEFILDNATGEFFFMEMNTRLQVEHPVTEMVTGLDLVEWQVKVARGEPLPLTQDQVEQRLLGHEAGHAIEARIYAEIPEKGFVPDSGTLVHYVLPPRDSRVRVDAGFGEGDTVSAHYDPMIAKLITHGANRADALARLLRALESYEIAGVGTNIEFLKSVVRHPEFARGQVETAFIEKNEKSLFVEMDTPTEVLVQTALACFLKERKQSMGLEFADIWKGDNGVGFSPSAAYQSRSFEFASGSMNDNGKPSGRLMVITICEQRKNVFTVTLNHGSNVMKDLAVQMQVLDKPGASICKVQTFFPESRLDTTIVFPKDVSPEMGAGPITAFQHGHKFTVHASPPEWLQKLLSQRAASTPKSSVRAPMPCKILRVEVEPGQHVKANEPLVVIESMKMETVIRAPGPGTKVVKRVVHKVGVSQSFPLLPLCASICFLPSVSSRMRVVINVMWFLDCSSPSTASYPRSSTNANGCFCVT